MRHLIFSQLGGRRHYHCGISRIESGETTFLHDHDFPELFIVRRGQGWNLRSGQRQAMEPGSLVWVDPEDAHCLCGGINHTMEIVNLALAPAWWRRYARLFAPELNPAALSCLKHVCLNASELARLDAALLKLLTPNRQEDWLLLQGVTLAMEFFSRAGSNGTVPAPPAWLEEMRGMMSDPQWLAKPVPWWQARCGCSKEHLARCCRRFYGRTLTELLNESRVGWVQLQLLDHRKTVTALALEAGFNHLGHFYATFKALTGITPREWEKQNTRVTVP